MVSLEHKVLLLDREGNTVGRKMRSEVDNTTDILRSVHIVIINPGEKVWMAIIPADDYHEFPGRLGTTSATIVRDGETSMDAAKRILKTEFYLENVSPKRVGTDYFNYKSGSQRFIDTYILNHEGSLTFNQESIPGLVLLDRASIEKNFIGTGGVAECFQLMWEQYCSDFFESCSKE